MIFVGNGISPKMFTHKQGLMKWTEISQKQFHEETKNKREEIVNCMGHKTRHIDKNRINIKLLKGDTIYVIQGTMKRKRRSPRPRCKTIHRIEVLDKKELLKNLLEEYIEDKEIQDMIREIQE